MREVFERVLAGESLWAITGDFTKRIAARVLGL